MSSGAEHFVQKIEEYTRGKVEYPFDFEFELSGFMLRGRFSEVYASGYVHMHYAKRKAKDLLKLWLHHLIYCDLKPEELPDNSFLICKDKVEKFNRPSNPRKIMETLLNLYLQGLTEPIQFFPETSLVYVQQAQNEKNTRQKALAGAIISIMENPEEGELMGQKGRFLSHNFSTEAMVKKIEVLYNRLLTQN